MLSNSSIAPLNQYNINAFGWSESLLIMCVLLGLIVPLAYVLKGRTVDQSAKTEQAENNEWPDLNPKWFEIY